MWVERQERGPDPRPKLCVEGEALRVFREHNIGDTHLSLSHDEDYTTAYVLLNSSGRPALDDRPD